MWLMTNWAHGDSANDLFKQRREVCVLFETLSTQTQCFSKNGVAPNEQEWEMIIHQLCVKDTEIIVGFKGNAGMRLTTSTRSPQVE